MKKILLITAFIGIIGNSYGQREEFYEVYKVLLCASEVAPGTKKFSGSGQTLFSTELLKKPQVVKVSGDFMSELGTYRIDYRNYQAGINPLFNLSSDAKSFPLLDTIDIDFYWNYGLAKMLTRNPSLANDTSFLRLRKTIRDNADSWPVKKMKKFIFSSSFDHLRGALIASRFDTLMKPFSIDHKKASVSVAKLKASLEKAVIANGIPLDATMEGYLQNIADLHSKVHGYYYVAQFDPNYIGKVQYFLGSIVKLNTTTDQFAYYLKDYVNSTSAALNSEMVAIKLNGIYDRKSISIAKLSAELSSKFGIGAEKAGTLAASLELEFSKNEQTTVQTSFSNVYILRYFTSKQLDDLVFKPLKATPQQLARFN